MSSKLSTNKTKASQYIIWLYHSDKFSLSKYHESHDRNLIPSNCLMSWLSSIPKKTNRQTNSRNQAYQVLQGRLGLEYQECGRSSESFFIWLAAPTKGKWNSKHWLGSATSLSKCKFIHNWLDRNSGK